MEKLQASQLAKISIFILLFFIIPFVSAPMRPPYLYFLLNLLIVVLAVEAGFLTAISGPRDESQADVVVTPPLQSSSTAVSASRGGAPPEMPTEKPDVQADEMVEVGAVSTLKSCLSMPSLFLIGGDEGDGEFPEEEVVVEVAAEEAAGDISAQELFAKAEIFIGNFYKQLKMQREDSWRQIHGLYQL